MVPLTDAIASGLIASYRMLTLSKISLIGNSDAIYRVTPIRGKQKSRAYYSGDFRVASAQIANGGEALKASPFSNTKNKFCKIIEFVQATGRWGGYIPGDGYIPPR